MKTETISIKIGQAIYFISDEVLVRNEQDALDLIGEANCEAIILHNYNFEKEFFDLSTRKLGDILQKFTNYRVQLAIIGNFSVYPSKVLPHFIAESNRQNKYIFVGTIEEVKNLWNAT